MATFSKDPTVAVRPLPLWFSMLHDDPGRRIPAEMALCSPFFSIPFGKLHTALVLLGHRAVR